MSVILSTSRFLGSACIPVGHLHQTSSVGGNIPRSMMPLVSPNFIHPTSASLKKEILATAAIVPMSGMSCKNVLGTRTFCRSPSLLKKCPFVWFLSSFVIHFIGEVRWGQVRWGEVRRIWAIALSRLCESQTHQSGFWFLPVFWFPSQLFSHLDVWPHHWFQKLHCSGLAEVFAVPHCAGAEIWPWGKLQTTGIEL